MSRLKLGDSSTALALAYAQVAISPEAATELTSIEESITRVDELLQKRGAELRPLPPHQGFILVCDFLIDEGEIELARNAVATAESQGWDVELMSHID